MKQKLKSLLWILLLITVIQINAEDNQYKTLNSNELDEELVRKFLEPEKPIQKKSSKSKFYLPKGATLLSKNENIFYGRMRLFGKSEAYSKIILHSKKLDLWKYNIYILKTGCIDQGGGWKKCADSDGYYEKEIKVNNKPENNPIYFAGDTTVIYEAKVVDFGDIYSDNSGVVYVFVVFIPEEFKVIEYSETAINLTKENRKHRISLSTNGRLNFK